MGACTSSEDLKADQPANLPQSLPENSEAVHAPSAAVCDAVSLADDVPDPATPVEDQPQPGSLSPGSVSSSPGSGPVQQQSPTHSKAASSSSLTLSIPAAGEMALTVCTQVAVSPAGSDLSFLSEDTIEDLDAHDFKPPPARNQRSLSVPVRPRLSSFDVADLKQAEQEKRQLMEEVKDLTEKLHVAQQNLATVVTRHEDELQSALAAAQKEADSQLMRALDRQQKHMQERMKAKLRSKDRQLQQQREQLARQLQTEQDAHENELKQVMDLQSIQIQHLTQQMELKEQEFNQREAEMQGLIAGLELQVSESMKAESIVAELQERNEQQAQLIQKQTERMVQMRRDKQEEYMMRIKKEQELRRVREQHQKEIQRLSRRRRPGSRKSSPGHSPRAPRSKKASGGQQQRTRVKETPGNFDSLLREAQQETMAKRRVGQDNGAAAASSSHVTPGNFDSLLQQAKQEFYTTKPMPLTELMDRLPANASSAAAPGASATVNVPDSPPDLDVVSNSGQAGALSEDDLDDIDSYLSLDAAAMDEQYRDIVSVFEEEEADNNKDSDVSFLRATAEAKQLLQALGGPSVPGSPVLSDWSPAPSTPGSPMVMQNQDNIPGQGLSVSHAVQRASLPSSASEREMREHHGGKPKSPATWSKALRNLASPLPQSDISPNKLAA